MKERTTASDQVRQMTGKGQQLKSGLTIICFTENAIEESQHDIRKEETSIHNHLYKVSRPLNRIRGKQKNPNL